LRNRGENKKGYKEKSNLYRISWNSKFVNIVEKQLQWFGYVKILDRIRILRLLEFGTGNDRPPGQSTRTWFTYK
jgi:hypothetical protein